MMQHTLHSDTTMTSKSRGSCGAGIAEHNLLRQEMVLDVELLEDSLQLQDKVRSSAVLVAVILKVYRVIDIQAQLQLVHVLDLFDNHTVRWSPVLGLAIYVPVKFLKRRDSVATSTIRKRKGLNT